MRLKCSNKKCGYEWDYNGNNPFYACCSRCKTPVNIERNKIINETQN